MDMIRLTLACLESIVIVCLGYRVIKDGNKAIKEMKSRLDYMLTNTSTEDLIALYKISKGSTRKIVKKELIKREVSI